MGCYNSKLFPYDDSDYSPYNIKRVTTPKVMPPTTTDTNQRKNSTNSNSASQFLRISNKESNHSYLFTDNDAHCKGQVVDIVSDKKMIYCPVYLYIE